ncbi:MAG: hypothetical protein J5643_08130 [Lachnospiraceae bacterium]|nr:hypothetical protein [Lachnospiraceae bacterium]
MRAKNRGRIIIAVLAGLLSVMTGVCYADMGNPAGLLILVPFMLILFIYALTAIVTILFVVIGLYLLVWRLIHRKAKRKHRLVDHIDIVISVLGGFLCSGVIIGFPMYFKALRKAAQYFFDDVAANDTERPNWNVFCCVAGEIVYSALLWILVLIPLDGRIYRARFFGSYFRTMMCDSIYVTVYRTPVWIVCFGGALILLWSGILIVYHIRCRKEPERLKKRIPDELAVYGFLILGFIWLHFGGIAFYYLAWRLGKSVWTGEPVQIIKKDVSETEETAETQEALRKMQSLDGIIKKDGQSEDE